MLLTQATTDALCANATFGEMTAVEITGSAPLAKILQTDFIPKIYA